MTDAAPAPPTGNNGHPRLAAEPPTAEAAPGAVAASVPLGLVDGSEPASSRRFQVVLDDDAVAQLDELVATTTSLADGRTVTHYGIVVEATGRIEGAELPSDTARISQARTMPGVTVRRAEVQLLRSVPEMWLHPGPGAMVTRASGPARDAALFLDQMTHPLAVGFDAATEPVYLDFAFLNGDKGGHVSISGVSGVATKTSYATFLLYMLFETDAGRALLGPEGPNTKAVVFNVKGEDLLHLDRPNADFDKYPEAAAQWEALGVSNPGAFTDVTIFTSRVPGRDDLTPAVTSRGAEDVVIYGWTPEAFIRQGLLRFCVDDDDSRSTQISFIEERVRVQLARHAHPIVGERGAVVLRNPADGENVSFVFDRAVRDGRPELPAGAGHPVRNFDDLLDFLVTKLDPTSPDPDWTGGVQQGTIAAFMRRLYAQGRRLGHLIGVGLTEPAPTSAVNVVDIHSLHDAAQRFVVGAILSSAFEAKQGSGREPLRFIVLDELNKYAPKTGHSPIKEVLVDIAARGRSLGVLLIGAQQSAGDVDGNIIRNAAIKVVGRLDAGEAAEYRFLSPELRERATRFLPGTMVLDQPLVPAPLPMRFPFPGYATNVTEGRRTPQERAAAQDDVLARLR